MFAFKRNLAMLTIALSFGIIACGEGDDEPPPVETHTIGGTATGLSAPIVVRLKVDGENFEDLTIDADGTFTFEDEVDDGSEYEVLPIDIVPGCPTFHIVNESGTANGNVTTIEIECS